jgi:hypothetical protein
VATILAKAAVKKPQTFKQTELEPRLDEARAGKRAIFSDAAQVILTPFLGFPGSFGRPFY